MNVRHAVCFLAYRLDGKVLAIYRNNKPIGWSLLAGKVEPGETGVQAVVREAKEEAGIDVIVVQQVYESHRVVTRDNGETEEWIVTAFIGLYTGDIKGSEEGKVEWREPYDLVEGPFGKYNRELFKIMGCEVTCSYCNDMLEDCPICYGNWQ